MSDFYDAKAWALEQDDLVREHRTRAKADIDMRTLDTASLVLTLFGVVALYLVLRWAS